MGLHAQPEFGFERTFGAARETRAAAAGKHLLRPALVLTTAIALLRGHPCAAQSPHDQPPPVSGVLLAEQTDLLRLVDLTAARLGIVITYDSAALRAIKTVVRQAAPISDEELWLLTNRVLAEQGFAIIRGTDAGSMSVVRAPQAAQFALIEDIDPDRAVRAGLFRDGEGALVPGFRKLVVHPRRVSSAVAVAATQPALSKPAGTVSEIPGTDAIVITDYTPYVVAALRTLAGIESASAAGTVVREVPLRNVDAAKASALARQLADRRKASGGGELRGDVLAGAGGAGVILVSPAGDLAAWLELLALADKRDPTERRVYVTPGFDPAQVTALLEQAALGVAGVTGSGDDRFRIIVDSFTGSLIITATASQHAAIQEVVDRLDAIPPSARRPMRTFVIRNRPIDEVVSILTELLHAGLPADRDEHADSRAPSPAPGAGVSGPASAPTAAAASPMVVALPPPPPPSPGVPASPPEQRAPASPPPPPPPAPASSRSGEPPVAFTVDKGTSTLIAVGEPRILDQIAALLKTLDVRQPQVMLEVLLVTLTDGQTLDLGVELEKLEVSGDTLIRLSSLFGLGSRTQSGDRDGPANASGFTGVVLNPGDFSVVLRALETLNHGRAVSMPRLLVGNNEQATLDSVVQQPFASVNASNTVSTTSFGGTQDAGTVVTIQPQIAEGDHLLLQYSVSLSAFLGPASSPTLPPPRQQNRVQSVATIPDGFTVVVGGIEIENTSQAVSQVPLLGSIPIIGEAFKSRSKGDSRSRFYVFIRANVLRHGGFEDLKYISEADVAGAGVDDGWPRLRPRVIR